VFGPSDPTPGHPTSARPSWQRTVAQSAGIALAALLAYAVWRGYQNPDLLLDLAAFRLC